MGRLGFSLQGGRAHYRTTVTADDAGRFSFLLGERRDHVGPWQLQLRGGGGLTSTTIECEAQAGPDGCINVGELRFAQ